MSNIDVTSSFDNNIKEENENCDYDEIKQYINTRYVSPPEALYRLLEYPMHELSHFIYGEIHRTFKL